MADENVFRFIAVRPARSHTARAAERRLPLSDSNSDFQRTIEDAGGQATRAELIRLGEEFRNGPAYVHVPRWDGFDAAPLLAWFEANRKLPLRDVDFASVARTLYGSELAALLDSQPFRDAYAALGGTILADHIAPPSTGGRDKVLVAYKLLSLLRRAGETQIVVDPAETLGRWIGRATVVLPTVANLRTATPLEETGTPPVAVSQPEPDTESRKWLKELEAAHRELRRKARDTRALRAREPEGPPPVKTPQGVPSPRRRKEIVFTDAALQSLSETTRRVLQYFDFEPGRTSPYRALDLIEREAADLYSRLPPLKTTRKMLMFGGAFLDVEKFAGAFGWAGGWRPEPPNGEGIHPVLRCSLKPGIGDLLIVKQTLRAYEAADFAHVENVLSGETRERTHRRLNVREETTILETERETSEERDLQSTERNELQTEAAKTIKNELQLQAGLQISGFYGPGVTFSSSLNASFSETAEETERRAVAYSREVTEKTAESIRERVREERRRRLLEEVEEINKHAVVSSGQGHTRGFYRWLNKIYDAQVFSYGQRMMFDFVIPEPAAYFLYATVENPPEGSVLEEPLPPQFENEDGILNPLRPDDLSTLNYLSYVAAYRVTGAPAPPAAFKVEAYASSQSGQDAGNFAVSDKITVEPGYEAFGVAAGCDIEGGQGPLTHLFVGGMDLFGPEMLEFVGWFEGEPSSPEPQTRQKELSIGYLFRGVSAYTMAVDVYCRLAADGLAQWQQLVYDAILNAYLQQKTDWEEKIAASGMQGARVLGRNPIENQRLAREELKKLALIMLTRFTDIGYDSYYEDEEPVIDVQKACQAGKQIRFFENAFEWNNMQYVFYPYFWGRKVRWSTALQLTDPDPEFAAFLRAGAARVQIPVRPGFERAVSYFCQTGLVPDGNEVALVDDDLFVPIVEEITEALDRPAGGAPYPEDSAPWKVVVPTSLVVLQDFDEIPGISDALSGAPTIDISSPNV